MNIIAKIIGVVAVLIIFFLVMVGMATIVAVSVAIQDTKEQEINREKRNKSENNSTITSE